MSQLSSKWYIGYLSGPKGEMYPDVFCHYTSLATGRAWGSYLTVAGPYDSASEARGAVKQSLTRNGLWPEKR